MDLNLLSMPPSASVKDMLPLLTQQCSLDAIGRQEPFLRRPEDPETIHDLRVSLRQLRSLISFFKPFYSSDSYQAAQDCLRRLTLLFARARELDVIAASWIDLKTSFPRQLDGADALLKTLDRERSRELDMIYPFIASGRFCQELLDVSQQLSDGLLPDNPAITEAWDIFIRHRLSTWLMAIKQDMAGVSSRQLSVIHPLRIRFKKLRYILNLLKPVIDGEHLALLKQAKLMQETLGSFCDIHRSLIVLQALRDNSAGQQLHFEIGILMGHALSESLILSDRVAELDWV